jgi:hypothetical protein
MSTPSANGWTRCPPGSFRRLAANLTARRQRQLWLTRLAWTVGAVVAIAASVGGASAIESYVFYHRTAPGGCGSSSIPVNTNSNPITPAGEAPSQSGGCK